MDYKVTDTQLSSIADAIRIKRGTSAPLAFPSAFISAINAIPTGSGASLGTKSIASNGVYSASADGLDGYSEVTVSVPLPEGSISIFENGTYDIASYASAVVSVSASGGSDDNFRIVIGDMTGSIYDSVASTLKPAIFSGNTKLTEIQMDALTTIGSSTFRNCTSLKKATFPLCTVINADAFSSCTTLSQVSFPKCVSINGYCFTNCKSLAEIDFPDCTYVGGYAFNGCSRLSQVSLPSCISIMNDAFGYCSTLNKIEIPMCQNIGQNAFTNAIALSQISMPSCVSIGNSAFFGCSNLETAFLPAVNKMSANVFSGCSKLSQVYLLRGNVVTTQQTANYTFYNTPITNSAYLGYYGSIYVPASLYDAYISASNWTVISDRIVSLTDEEIAAL